MSQDACCYSRTRTCTTSFIAFEFGIFCVFVCVFVGICFSSSCFVLLFFCCCFLSVVPLHFGGKILSKCACVCVWECLSVTKQRVWECTKIDSCCLNFMFLFSMLFLSPSSFLARLFAVRKNWTRVSRFVLDDLFLIQLASQANK